ncbi:hypothetical protein FQR65_LT15937 [Abscondita terminalis]|nr:hypothetical protein FQR65_LT15937 [Abscondita terminalis]
MASINDRKEVIKCLDALLKRLGITRKSMETDSGFGKGANYTGDIIKIVPFRDVTTRKILCIKQAYQCEAFMYETVFSSFARMQSDANIKDRFDSYPKYYASSMKAMEELVVLENLTSFQVGDRLETLTYHQARILAKEIVDYLCVNVVESQYLALYDSEKFRTQHEKVRTFPSKIHEMYLRYYRFDPEDEHGVIGHCDLWSTNLLYNEQEIRIIDWQTARVCSPAVDLSLILFICCDAEVRNQHGQDLIEAYHDSCSTMLGQFGEDPNAVFSRTVLEKHLKMYSGYALCLALRTVTMISVPEDEVLDPSKARNYIDLIDMYKNVSMDPKIFDARIRGILTDYVSYGYDM